MLPQGHLILGIILVAGLLLVFPSIGVLGASIILASSVLIDVDHYLYYIYKTKKLNPIKAYYWFRGNALKCKNLPKEKRCKVHFGTYILHGVEVLIILFTLGFFVSNIFYFILVGFTFHLIVDLSTEIIKDNEFNKISIISKICSLCSFSC